MRAFFAVFVFAFLCAAFLPPGIARAQEGKSATLAAPPPQEWREPLGNLRRRLDEQNNLNLSRLETVERRIEGVDRHINQMLLIVGLGMFLVFFLLLNAWRAHQRLHSERLRAVVREAEKLMGDMRSELERPQFAHLRAGHYLRKMMRRRRDDSPLSGADLRLLAECRDNGDLPASLYLTARALLAERAGDWRSAAVWLEHLRAGGGGEDADVLLHLAHVHTNLAAAANDKLARKRHLELTEQFYARFAVLMRAGERETPLPPRPAPEPAAAPKPEIIKPEIIKAKPETKPSPAPATAQPILAPKTVTQPAAAPRPAVKHVSAPPSPLTPAPKPQPPAQPQPQMQKATVSTPPPSPAETKATVTVAQTKPAEKPSAQLQPQAQMQKATVSTPPPSSAKTKATVTVAQTKVAETKTTATPSAQAQTKKPGWRERLPRARVPKVRIPKPNFAAFAKNIGELPQKTSAAAKKAAAVAGGGYEKLMRAAFREEGELPLLPTAPVSPVPKEARGAEKLMWGEIRRGDEKMAEATAAPSLRARNRLIDEAVTCYARAQSHKTNETLYHNWGLALLAKALHMPEKKRQLFFNAAADKFMAGNVVRKHYFDFSLAALYAIMRNTGECHRWLRKSAESGTLDMDSLRRAPDFESVRGLPWFAEFIRE